MIQILGIAPYEGLRELMEAVAALREDVALTVRVGDYRAGLDAALAEEPGSYDVILSRGGTAELLRRELETPVVSVELSVLDLLKALQLAEGSGRDFAVVGFPTTAALASKLCALLHLSVPVEEVDGPEASDAAALRLREQGIGLILGDTMITEHARRAGLQAMLLTSGSESVAEAFDRAAELVAYYGRAREEERYLRGALDGEGAGCVVLESSGALCYSSFSQEKTRALLPMLRRVHRAALRGGGFRRALTGAKQLWRVTGERLPGGRVRCLLRPLAARETQDALFWKAGAEAEEERLLQVFYDADDALREKLRLAGSAALTVLVGEEGCGKDALALRCRGADAAQETPLIVLDCEGLSERALRAALYDEDSPLLEKHQTVYLRRPDALPKAAFELLMNAFKELSAGNRCIISLLPGSREVLRAISALRAPLLIQTAPLRARIHEIPGFVSMYVSELGREQAQQLAGVEPEAMSALQSFAWPGNCRQLCRVLEALPPLADGPFITAASVRALLSGQNAARAGTAAAGETLAIDRPLADTVAEIAQRVFEQEGRNMTRSAEKLGISRTTLWRYLKR